MRKAEVLTEKQHRAVQMLFTATDEEIMRELRISRKTLDAWKADPEFNQAVSHKVKENRRVAVRLLSQGLVDAARELDRLLRSGDEKTRQKAIVDVLKASGLLKDGDADEGDYIGNLLRQIDSGPGAESEDDDAGEED